MAIEFVVKEKLPSRKLKLIELNERLNIETITYCLRNLRKNVDNSFRTEIIICDFLIYVLRQFSVMEFSTRKI